MTKRKQDQSNKSRYHYLVEQAKKWPNLEEGIANDFAIGRFKEDLVHGAKDIATRLYEATESGGVYRQIQDLVDLRYAYIMSYVYDERIGMLLDQVRYLMGNKFDHVRNQEMRETSIKSAKMKKRE